MLQKYDQALDYANQSGLNVFLVTALPGFILNNYPVKHLETIKSYYSNLAQRYASNVDIWQLFNEPDIHHFLDYSTIVDFNNYYGESLAESIGAANKAIKEQNSNAVTTTNMTYYPGLNISFRKKAFGFFDTVSPYIDILSIDLYPDADLSEINRLDGYIELLKERYGKDIAVAEIGLPTDRFSVNDQSRLLSKSLSVLKNGRIRPKMVLIYELMDEKHKQGSEAFMGVLDTQGNPKSSFQSLILNMRDDLKTEEYGTQPSQ